MRIIISPAKQMREDRDTLPPRGLPGFLPETGRLLSALRNLSPAELQKLWKCSDAIARQNGQTCCVIGARPMRAMAFDDEKGLLAAGVNETSAAAFAKDLAARVPLGSNLRAGEEYRRLVCEALVRRGLVQMEGC